MAARAREFWSSPTDVAIVVEVRSGWTRVSTVAGANPGLSTTQGPLPEPVANPQCGGLSEVQGRWRGNYPPPTRSLCHGTKCRLWRGG
eukprot:11191328-Lingulodinium_polyedra.AAC.1